MKYRKYRLTKQRRGYDCGAAAIVNTMKLCGKAVSYNASQQSLFQALNIQENKGVYTSEFEAFIFKHRFLKKRLVFGAHNPTIKEVEDALKLGLVAILAFGRGPAKSGHLCVIAGRNREGFEIVNWDKKETIQTIGFDRFKNNVLIYKEATYYFFEKETNDEIKKNNRGTVKRNGSKRRGFSS